MQNLSQWFHHALLPSGGGGLVNEFHDFQVAIPGGDHKRRPFPDIGRVDDGAGSVGVTRLRQMRQQGQRQPRQIQGRGQRQWRLFRTLPVEGG